MKFNDKYQKLFYSSPDPIFIESLAGIILEANQAALEMHGVSYEEMIGRNFIEFVPEEQRSSIKSNVENFIEEQIRIFESVATDKNGYEVPIEITASVINYDNDKAILVHVREISKRKSIELELQNSHEQLRNLSRHLQNIREIESTKIARDLHDVLGQDLTALKFEISFLKRKIGKLEGNAELKSQFDEKLTSMLQLTSSTLDTVRKITSNLRPTVLDDMGLSSALDWLVLDFMKRTNISTKLFNTISDSLLNKELSTSIYRIIQESLTNIIRHAEATEVKIYCSESNKELEIRVVDNGKGITGPQIERTKSFGIVGIKERALGHNGKFEIFGEPGSGTTVYVIIPLQND